MAHRTIDHWKGQEKSKNKKQSMEQRILAAWDMFEEIDPDISTERLFAMVEDETGADAGDISYALMSRQI